MKTANIQTDCKPVLPAVYSLIKDGDDIAKLLGLDASQESLTDEQEKEIRRIIGNGESCQQAIFAGLRALANYTQIAGASEHHDIESLNDLSWIVSHLSLELEGITETVSGLNWCLSKAAKAKPATYETGIQKGRKECWEAIHKLMEANRVSTCDDRQDETKGLTLASTAIFEMMNGN